MKRILLLLFAALIAQISIAQTAPIDARLTIEQILRNSLKVQDNTKLPVIRLVPVKATNKFNGAEKLSKDQIINGLFRKMPDGTFAMAVDSSLIGGGSKATNLSLAPATATSQTINNSNGTGVTLNQATTASAGLMNASDKTKLNLITATQPIDLDAVSTTLSQKQDKIQYKDEGTNTGTLGAITNVNFTGAGVTATASGNTLTVNVSAVNPSGEYINDSDAASNGVAVGQEYYIAQNNTMGMAWGIRKRRAQ